MPMRRVPMKKKCGSVECAVQFSTKFSGLSETVPDILTNYLRCKIGKSIGVYSANSRNKYRVFGFAELQAGIPAV